MDQHLCPSQRWRKPVVLHGVLPDHGREAMEALGYPVRDFWHERDSCVRAFERHHVPHRPHSCQHSGEHIHAPRMGVSIYLCQLYGAGARFAGLRDRNRLAEPRAYLSVLPKENLSAGLKITLPR